VGFSRDARLFRRHPRTELAGGGAVVTSGECSTPTSKGQLLSSACIVTDVNILGSSHSGSGSDVHGQAYYFFKDFSVFGPKNDPRPSCFARFLKELPRNFFGYSGADITGSVATATYILTPPSPVPPTMALRGGKYALNWIKADNVARAAKATWAGLAANLVFAETVALGNELDSALNGNCK
jgi:hypothetical protein